jgi:pimeloyl-ACP methyl ester carboxylesterase
VKLLLAIAGVVLLAVAGWALALTNGAFDIAADDLEARYRTPESRFLDVGGVRLHYRDEGQGPAIVLVHASYMNLRSWDPLADSLKASHRVIRLDQLTNGLTRETAGGEISMDRNVELLGQLADALRLERFSLLGTSSGATVAFRYAAANPGRIERLILVNSAGLPRTPMTDPNRPRGSALSRWITSYHRSHAYWAENLARQFEGSGPPPAWLVDMCYDMNRREGLAAEGARYMRAYRTGDPETTLGQITAPTMILWGMGNSTVDHLQADVFQHWLVSAPTLKKKYPKVGHYLYLEIPDEFNADVAAFLDGRLDSQLRVTTRAGFTRPEQS